MANSGKLSAVGGPSRAIGFGIVAGLVVSQATTALFDDLVTRQTSFDAVGWGNFAVYLALPVVAGSVLLHYGRHARAERRSPERAVLASLFGLVVAAVLLRLLTPAILHAGDLIVPRVPRTVADGFTYVADYARMAPLAGNGGRLDVIAAVVSSAVVAGAVAFGAMAFERKAEPVLACVIAGAGWAVLGWFVPGGAGVRIIGSLWPVFVLGSLGAVLALTDRSRVS